MPFTLRQRDCTTSHGCACPGRGYHGVSPAMSETDAHTVSRVCPACRRIVPVNIAQCRCGAKMPDEPASLAARDEPEPPASSDFAAGVRFGLIVALGLGVIGAAAFFINRPRPAPARPVASIPRLVIRSEGRRVGKGGGS